MSTTRQKSTAAWLAEGHREFNRGEFFECHETLEERSQLVT